MSEFGRERETMSQRAKKSAAMFASTQRADSTPHPPFMAGQAGMETISTQPQAVTLPESLQSRLGSVEHIPLHRAVKIAEERRKAVETMVIDLGA